MFVLAPCCKVNNKTCSSKGDITYLDINQKIIPNYFTSKIELVNLLSTYESIY